MRKSALRRSVWFVWTLAASAGCVPLRAQSVGSLQPGIRVRVTPSIGDLRFVGTLVGLVRDTLTVQPENRSDTVVVLLTELKRLERSTGPRSHALMGAGIGLLIGAGAPVIADRTSGDQSWSGLTAIGATVCGVLGTLVGATIGSHFPTEGWQLVRASSGSSVSVGAHGVLRLTFALSVSL